VLPLGTRTSSLQGWRLPALALSLTLLALFIPGRGAAEIEPANEVLLPYFEVDLSDPFFGMTTLFALVNSEDDPVDVSISVHTNWGIPVLGTPVRVTLKGNQVLSVNLRDWLVFGQLPDRTLTPAELADIQARLSGKPSTTDDLYYGTADSDHPSYAIGYVLLKTVKPTEHALWGDYIEIGSRDANGGALCQDSTLLGETLVNLDPAVEEPPTCRQHGVRFLSDNALKHSTQVLVWTRTQGSPSPTPTPSERVSTSILVYDEPGHYVETLTLDLMPVEVIEVDRLDLQLDFGWLYVHTPDEESFLTEHLHSADRPAAALHAWCFTKEKLPPSPTQLEFQKLVNGADADTEPGPRIPVGDPVTWELRVQNTGSGTLTDVVVKDDGVTVACPKTMLAPNESMTCILTGISEECQQRNVASVSAVAANGSTVTAEDPAHYFGQPDASLSLEKRLNGKHYAAPPWPRFQEGDALNWTFVVKNTGAVALTVTVTDKNLGLTVRCPKQVLQPNESMTCTVPPTKAVAGHHTNTATAKGTHLCADATAIDVLQTDTAGYDVYVPEPRIDLEKLINEQDADTPRGPTLSVGAPVTWKFVVTNIGDETLTGIQVTDGVLGRVSCPNTSLSMGSSMTCTLTGTAQPCQQGGPATASGTGADSGDRVEDTDPAWYYGQPNAAATLETRVNGQDADTPPGLLLAAGTPVAWTYEVRNSGNVRLTDIAVEDEHGVAATCPRTVLDPGQSLTCTRSGGTAATGDFHNIGTITAAPPCGADVTASDPAYYHVIPAGIGLTKLTNGHVVNAPEQLWVSLGSPVQWSYEVRNSGSSVLTGIVVTDNKVAPVSCPKTELQPDETMTCTASGTAVSGHYANAATATGKPPVGSNVTATATSYYWSFRPGITIDKKVNGLETTPQCNELSLEIGQPVTWTYQVTNTGDIPLTGVAVTDSIGVVVSCPRTDLAVGGAMTCAATGVAIAGPQSNIGTATGQPPAGPPVSASDTACYQGLVPGILLEKLFNGVDADTSPGPTLNVGTALLWSYVVTNTGEVPLSNVTVTDSAGFPVCTEHTGPIHLLPAQSVTCLVGCIPGNGGGTAADTCVPPPYCIAGAGYYHNIGTATGASPAGFSVSDQDPCYYFGQNVANQGCSRSYWAGHTSQWQYPPYSTLVSVFPDIHVYYPMLDNLTLLEALSFPTSEPSGLGGAKALLSEAVPALLNGVHPAVAYPWTALEVVNATNEALKQTRTEMLALRTQFLNANSLGCPLAP
jgi:hypothetical protein